MEVVPAANLAERVAACGCLEPTVAAAVGRVVGELHAEASGLGPTGPRSDWLRGGLGIARPTPGRLRELTAGGVALTKLLQRSGGLEARLQALAAPAGGTLIHGDLRWENVLVEPGVEPRIRLVDWELGGDGEPAWDAGCFAAACISEWLCSIPAVPGIPPDRLTAEAALPMDALSPGLAAFWAAYRDIAPDARTDAWAERCAQLAAVFLVHRGFECTQHDVALEPVPVAHLQVAAHMLDDPLRAGRELLAMP
jgi:aminoglycoside phosphotransferase (APT) family kinase protein